MIQKNVLHATSLLSLLLLSACGGTDDHLSSDGDVPPSETAPFEVVEASTVATIELPNENLLTITAIEEDAEVMARETGPAPGLLNTEAEDSVLDVYLCMVEPDAPVPEALTLLEPEHPGLEGRTLVTRIEEPLEVSAEYLESVRDQLTVPKADPCKKSNLRAKT